MTKDIAISEKALELFNNIINVRSDVLLLQSKYDELIESNRVLENQLMELKSWEKNDKLYQLSEVSPGFHAYIPKNLDDFSGTKHMLCANCYNQKQKSFVQFKSKKKDYDLYECPTCKNKINLYHSGFVDKQH